MSGVWIFRRRAGCAALLAAVVLPAGAEDAGAREGAARVAEPAREFLRNHCLDCHDGHSRKGSLDLETLAFHPADASNREQWIRVHDRVRDGEMPPKDEPRLAAGSVRDFLAGVAGPVAAAERAAAADGRAKLRRLNRHEYEDTLRDLLDAPWLQVKDFLPEDGESHRFNKVGGALDISYLQMSRYLLAADHALRAVLAQERDAPAATTVRYYAREQASFRGSMRREMPDRETFPVLGTMAQPEIKAGRQPLTVGASDPAIREREAMGVVLSSFQPVELRFDQFKAPVSGRYRVRVQAYSLWFGLGPTRSPAAPIQPSAAEVFPGRRAEPVVVYAETVPRRLRRLGAFDAAAEPTVGEFAAWLLAGETLRPDAVRLFRPRGPRRNPLAEADGMPGVAFTWAEVEGPLRDPAPGGGYRLLFDDLPFKVVRAHGAGRLEVLPRDPAADAARLLQRFAAAVYRQPVAEEEVATFLPLITAQLQSGAAFADAMLTGYAAVLCSPRFLFLEEPAGALDDHAVAARLSYFLWNSRPDETLLALARRGELRRPGVLRAQTDRMLDDPRAARFTSNFLDYWLDLRKITADAPDAALYPDYYLDDFLVDSALEESRRFFGELLARDLPASSVVDSEFAMLNERLANHYGVPGVQGAALRRVALPPESPRGGMMTQAGVLKVTANGTTTSPVIRGAWTMERLLGRPPSPPPPGVGSVEPDIRGAQTIRQQLEQHRGQASCAACHAQFDPAGFALESFDVMGGWRDRYRAVDQGVEAEKGFGRLGQKFVFHHGPAVDASGRLPDGRSFADIREFKRLLLADERLIAHNLTRQLAIYATGAPVRFADRAEIEAILERASSTRFGLRTLVQEIIQSPLFLHK